MKEAKLIKEYMKKDKLEIENVIHDYTPYLYTILHNKNIDLKDEDIEEIIADVFLAVWKNQKRLKKDKKMSSYLAEITNHLFYKKSKTIKKYIDIHQCTDNLFYRDSMETIIEKSQKENLVINAVYKMKDEDKRIFLAYYYYANSMKNIAKELEISEQKVKSRLFRIRRKLKKILEKEGYHYEQ